MLGKNEPPSFEVFNTNGATPLVIACDHAQNRVPHSLDSLGLSAENLGQHIAYDIGARQVAMFLSEMFDAPLIVAGYSRLVIDLNRHLNDSTLIAEVSDNVIVPGNQELDAGQRKQRIDEFFHPYHNAYSSLVINAKKSHSSPLILSVHSFTPQINGVDRPWEYGILWDTPHERISKLLISSLQNQTGKLIGDNQPYHANEPQGYAQVVHAQQNDLEMALVEIRQDLIEDAQGQAEAARVLYTALNPMLP